MENNWFAGNDEEKVLSHELDVIRKDLDTAHEEMDDLRQEIENGKNRLREKKALLEHSMDQIALMIEERKKMNQEIERLNTLYHTNLDNIIDLLVSLIISKCRQAGNDSRKIADISTYIAEALKKQPDEIRIIEMAARLNELGKLALSDRLLATPKETLSEREMHSLQQHPLKGAVWLERFMGLEGVGLLIRHLHENMDGSGIPDGLKGDDIPLGSRIIRAACIYYEAVFKSEAVDLNAALAMVEESAGATLDPRLVYYLHKYAHTHAPQKAVGRKEIRLYELEPGMTLACGVYNRQGAKLIPMDTLLTEALITKIVHYNSIDPLEQRIFVRI